MRKPTKALVALLLCAAVSVDADVVRTRGGGSGGGAAAAVTPGVTTVTGCQNRVLYGDNSSVLNCEAAFGYVTSTNTLTADNITAATQIIVPAGGAGATSSILFSNDTDTGIYSAGAGSINFGTNGTNRFQMGSGGLFSIASGVTIGPSVAAPDVSLFRNASGVLKLSNSAAGTVSTGFLGGGASLASASALPVPAAALFHVTGTTGITSITNTNLGAGACFTMIFDATLTVTDGSNLVMNGNFSATAGDTLSMCFDGTNFYETARSDNG